MTVVQDTADLVALYLHEGARRKYPAPLDGTSSLPDYLMAGSWRLVDRTWAWGDTLLLVRPGESHAVHVMWGRGTRDFVGWYINLQECLRRTQIGFDTMDQELDITVSSDLSQWAWKDEDLFLHQQQAGRFSLEEAREIRAQGERVLEFVRRWASPFGDGREDWTAPTDWPVPVLPQGWDDVSEEAAGTACWPVWLVRLAEPHGNPNDFT